MDDICSPVRYDQLTEEDVQGHLRYCGSKLGDGDRVEVLLCEAGVVIPIVKRVHRTKPSTLDVLARSGSIGRDRLIKLRSRLVAQGYDLKISFTSKRRLLRRIVVPLPIDDALFPLSGLGVLRSIASEVNVPWPCTMAVGYAIGSEGRGLPGRLTYRDPLARAGYRAGYQIGQAIGTIVRKISS